MFQRMGRRLREARELGSYELIERLGEGGMGEVWRARHRLLARPAAIKLMRPEMLGAATPAARRRWCGGASSGGAGDGGADLAAHHRLFDFGVADEGTFYYVMELLDGLDMATLVQRRAMPRGARAVPAKQVCHSLARRTRAASSIATSSRRTSSSAARAATSTS